MKIHLVLILALFISACANPYIQPVGENTASLIFHNHSNSNIGITGFNIGKDCSGGKLIFGKDSVLYPNDKLEIKIKTDEMFSYMYQYLAPISGGIESCNIVATFTPKKRIEYVSRYSMRDNKCYVNVLKITDSGEIIEPSFKKRNYNMPFSENGPFCK